MASVAEQLASNISFSAFKNATELKQRIWFTLLALLVYRFGTYLPLPGINIDTLRQIFEQNQSGIIGIFNMFAGGAVGRMAILSLGIMPYITSSIIIQLIVPVVPRLNYLKKEGGEQGRRQINQYTRYGTVFLATIQAWGIAVGLEGASGVVTDPGLFFKISAVITLVGGTIFLMWLGEQITQRGIGNGISLIIMVGIISRLPFVIGNEVRAVISGEKLFISEIILMGIMFLVICFVVLLTQGTRKIPVQYAKRVVGNKQYGGVRQFIPLKVNAAGVMPIIFAQAIMFIPVTVAQASGSESIQGFFAPLADYTGFWYNFMFFILCVVFTYFYTAITVNPKQMAEDMKRNGGFIPGIKPGRKTI